MRSAALLAAACLLSGCAAFGPSGVGADGLAPWDSSLRRLTASGQYEQALEATGRDEGDAAGDELLRLLQRGAVAHYAGDYAESNRVLQLAELTVEERYTRSVSRAALSLLANDRVLAYMPPLTEQLMIHYYGALNYLDLGQLDEAAVEARRLSGLLERTEDGEYDSRVRDFRTALRYFAGCVFEEAGERTDAEVAYRNAWLGWGREGERGALRGLVPVFLDTLPPPDSVTALDATSTSDTASAPALAPPPSLTLTNTRSQEPVGEVVVLLESGFVAHRVEVTLGVPVYKNEMGRMEDGAAASRYDAGLCAASRAVPGRSTGWRPSDCVTPDGDVVATLRVAWPQMRRTPDRTITGPLSASLAATSGVEGVAGEDPAVSGAAVMDVSGAAVAEFEERAPGMLAKAVVRAAAKLAVVGAVADEVKKDDKTLGDVLEVVGVVAVAASERADTRSWHLLPSAVRFVRLRLPAGRHRLHAQVSEAGTLRTREVDLGEVDVVPGRLLMVSHRVWP